MTESIESKVARIRANRTGRGRVRPERTQPASQPLVSATVGDMPVRKRKKRVRTEIDWNGAQQNDIMGRRPSKLVKIVVQKPFCAPVRTILTGTPSCPIYEVGVRYWDFEEHEPVKMAVKDAARRMKIELRELENLRYGPAAPGFLPMAMEASLWVSQDQLAYAVYCIERTQKLYVVEAKGVNVKRQRNWADRHDGKMPQPWYEPSCSEAKSIFDQVKNIKRKHAAKKGRKRKRC